jgi:hypothetical protein
MIKEKEINLNQSTDNLLDSDVRRNVVLYVDNLNNSENNNNSNENNESIPDVPGGTEISSSNLRSEINPDANNLNLLNVRGILRTQGFSRFRSYGMTSEEIYMLRVMFHTNYMVNNRNAPRTAWAPQEIIRREEDWITQVNSEENLNIGNSNSENNSDGNNDRNAHTQVIRDRLGMGTSVFNLVNNRDNNLLDCGEKCIDGWVIRDDTSVVINFKPNLYVSVDIDRL